MRLCLREGRLGSRKNRASKRRQKLITQSGAPEPKPLKKPKPSKEQVLVKTVAGNAIYPADMLVYSRLGEGNYIAKPVGHLEEGENLAWRMDSIDAVLEDVEPHLFKESIGMLWLTIICSRILMEWSIRFSR